MQMNRSITSQNWGRVPSDIAKGMTMLISDDSRWEKQSEN